MTKIIAIKPDETKQRLVLIPNVVESFEPLFSKTYIREFEMWNLKPNPELLKLLEQEFKKQD